MDTAYVREFSHPQNRLIRFSTSILGTWKFWWHMVNIWISIQWVVLLVRLTIHDNPCMHSCVRKSWNVVVDDGSLLRKLEVCHYLYYFGLCTSLSLKNAGDGTFAGRIFFSKNTWWVHHVQHRIAKGYFNSTCNKHRVIGKATTDPGLCWLEFARRPVCVSANESHNNQMSQKIILQLIIMDSVQFFNSVSFSPQFSSKTAGFGRNPFRS